MNDWVVIVKHRAEPMRQRVFVENVQYEDEAKRLALLKLGASPIDHEASADLIDERVSVKDPMYNSKELYKQALADLTESRRECQKAQELASAYLIQGEKMEMERNRLIRTNTLMLADLALMESALNNMQKNLEKLER